MTRRFLDKLSQAMTAIFVVSCLLVFLPGAVDKGMCSAADAGDNCSGIEIRNSTNEEISALYDRTVVNITGVTNSGNDYSGTATPALTQYVDGQHYSFRPSANNTGASQVNWNGIGLVALTMTDGSALANGTLISGSVYTVRYVAATNQMRIISVPGVGTLGDSTTVNGVAVTDFDLDDASPAAPAGGYNIKWQKDASSPANISGYTDFTGATDLTSPAFADSFLVNDDSVPDAIREVTLGNLLKIINVLNEDTTPDEAADFLSAYDTGAGTPSKVLISNLFKRLVREYCYALSDETTNLTTGNAKITFRAPRAITVTAVRASVNTAPVGSTIIVDINEGVGGAGTILSTKLSIDASERTSTTAASAAVLSDTSLADDAEMTMDIDQIGSSTAGKGLKVCIYGRDT